MTWTFDATDVSTDLAKVRQAIGDVETNAQLLSDEQINGQLTLYPSILDASIACVDLILAKLARDVDRSAVGFSGQRSQVLQHYRDLRVELSNRRSAGLECTHTGKSITGKQTLTSDTDKIQPVAGRDRFTNTQY
jgi:hypothetical protein